MHFTPAVPLLLSAFLLASGCSKEKAIALKTAAEAARAQAVTAVEATESMLARSVAVPPEARERLVDRLVRDFGEAETIDSTLFDTAIKDTEISDRARGEIGSEFGKLQARYAAFAAMFRSLPDGSYLAADAVQRAESHAMNLSLEFMAFAQALGRLPDMFTGERALLIEMINEDKLKPANVRDDLLKVHIARALDLRAAERAARDQAIVQCLRAAQAFRFAADLIRNYRKMSAADVLTATRELLTAANDISGNQAHIGQLLTQYSEIEGQIRSDPYWREVLTFTLNR